MEEMDDLPEVKEEKPEIMENDQVPVGPVQLKIIKIGGDDKTGQGLDHLQFVEMAKLARQAAAIANKVGGKANKRKELLVPRSTEAASGMMLDVAKDNSTGAKGLNGKGRDAEPSGKEGLSDDKRATTRKKDAERLRGWRALLSEEELVAVRKMEVAAKRRNRTMESERRRQKRAAWTEEERAAHRKKEAEQKRLKREAMSEEERAEVRKKNAEYARNRRRLMTPEEIEALRAADAEVKSGKPTGMTPEELAQFRARKAELQSKRLAGMTPEELASHRLKVAQCMRRRRLGMTKEEKAEMRQRTVINKLMKRAAMTEEEKEEQLWKERMREYARRSRMTTEERQEKDRMKMEVSKKWRKGLTGEKLERYKESLAKANKKYQQKCPPQKKGPNYMQKRYHKMVREETPEQRWKRLRVYRIEQAKRLLKRKLEREGHPQEEIEEKVQDLVKRMKEEPMPPPEAVSTYKPRPRKNCREPVEDSEPETSTLRVRTTRSKNTCAPSSSKDSSLSDMKTIEAEPVVQYVQLVQFSSDYFADHKEIFKDNDGAESADVFNDCDIQSDPLEDDKEESDIEESSNSPTTSCPASPVETLKTSANSFLAPPPPMIQLQPIAPRHPPQKCPHCPESFREENLLKDHIRSSHLNKCFKCPKCKEIVFSPKELSDHFKTHQTSTSAKSFTCLKCPKSVGFQSQEKLLEHVRLSHPGSFFPCQHCKVVMYSKPSLATHLEICKMSSLVCVDPRQARKCTDW